MPRRETTEEISGDGAAKAAVSSAEAKKEGDDDAQFEYDDISLPDFDAPKFDPVTGLINDTTDMIRDVEEVEDATLKDEDGADTGTRYPGNDPSIQQMDRHAQEQNAVATASSVDGSGQQVAPGVPRVVIPQAMPHQDCLLGRRWKG